MMQKILCTLDDVPAGGAAMEERAGRNNLQ